MRRTAQPAASKPDPKEVQKKLLDELTKIHPGFRTARSVVLHRAGTQHEYAKWRTRLGMGDVATHAAIGVDFNVNAVEATDATAETATEAAATPFGAPAVVVDEMIDGNDAMMGQGFFGGTGFQFNTQVGNFLLVGSQRNTTSLFGAGLIDSIPEAVLEEAAQRRFPEFPKVTGRVARLKDGKIGRFGWKSQKASLREFVMTACAVELGLNVPEHEQSGLPHNPKYQSPGLDLNDAECNALVSFVQHLPAPMQTIPPTSREVEYVDAGKAIFTKIGCATCHAERLGEVAGIYSDLALHDLGPQLADSGSYGVFLPNSADDGSEDAIVPLARTQPTPRKKLTPAEQAEEEKKLIGAKRQEWRTAPLWGVRDSSPYLHDGRAQTLEQAIMHHDGEARESRKRFSKLTVPEQLQLVSFLKSLTAPDLLAHR
jgi:Di-haem oxidoreductase, putative peroxidase